MFGWTACNFDWRDQQADKDASRQVENAEEKYGRVKVENLRMRENAGLDSREITQIGKEQFIRLTGKQSDTMEAISISGATIPYYWYEIIFNGDTGWIYGGGMEIIESENLNAGQLNDFLIVPGERVGLITRTSTHESLIRAFGPEEVMKSRLRIGEDQMVEGTTLFPNTNNELHIYWQNEDFKLIRQIVITKPGGQWQTSSGIHIGVSIEDVTAANGKPFEMTGFLWDLAGTTLNWQGGNLHQDLVLKFDYRGEISIYPFLIGDKVISSDNSSLLKLSPSVREILISFNG